MLVLGIGGHDVSTPPLSRALPGDRPAEDALAELKNQLHLGLQDVILGHGDVLVIDNQRAVHGRRRFLARYDGTDRWLRRGWALRDLKATRDRRRTRLTTQA